MKQQKKLHEAGPRLKYQMKTGMAVVLVCQSQSTTKSFIHHRLKEFPNPNPTTPSSSITLVYDQFQNVNPKLCPCPVIKNGVKNKKCEKCVQLTVRDIFYAVTRKGRPQCKTRSYKGCLRKMSQQHYCSLSLFSSTRSWTAAIQSHCCLCLTISWGRRGNTRRKYLLKASMLTNVIQLPLMGPLKQFSDLNISTEQT